MINILFYDFEVYKFDWLVCWLDTNTRQTGYIVNDKEGLENFYNKHKHEIWCGYNSRGYDQWILKAILCGFNPWEMNEWIIVKEHKGFEFSRLLNNYPLINYDCIYGFRSLKELEAFMGHDIRETTVPFDIDRPLTHAEIMETIKYCSHDVSECLEVFVESKEEYESHIGLVKEYDMPLTMLGKTKAQLSAIILGATRKEHNDEFDIRLPQTLELGKYQWIADWYLDWAKNNQCYEEMDLKTNINGVPHTFGIGGLHGAVENYYGEGYYLMADVSSYYPAMMIEYDYLSRNVSNPKKYRQIRDERLEMKARKDPRQKPRKIVLNATFGASKDKYNALYDPLQANNICIAGQLLLTDLLDKLNGKCELIQTNTDGILVKLYKPEDKEEIMDICKTWMARTYMDMEFDEYVKVIQKDVNNYIIVDKDGKVKRKGAYVKKLSALDNDLPIVNKAVVDYFVKGILPEQTIHESTKLMDFQKITKITGKFEYAVHNQEVLHEKVYRCFASKYPFDGTLYKKNKGKTTLDKTPATPEFCFIINDDVRDMPIPEKLDKDWYVAVANKRIKEFLGK